MTNADSEQLTTPPDGRPMEEQPRWRRDFPIDWPEDEYLSRREFIKFMLLTSGGMVMFVIIGVLLPVFDLNSAID